MKKNYKLIAFDMDGTLLNSEKKITKKTLEMIEKAEKQGKIVIFSTGRCPAELKEYIDVIPSLRYLNCISGALIYDLKENSIIYKKTIDTDIAKRVMEVATKENALVHFLNEKSIIQRNYIEKLKEYKMEKYIGLFDAITTKVDDMYKEYYENPFELEKINLYHKSEESRLRTKKHIEELKIPVTMVYSEKASLEVSALGVNKGTGLKELCKHLNIDIEQTIAIGDADNDLEVLKIAGLAVAMGNANENVKAIADVEVSDCDHDGCAETIERYLLD